MVFTYHGAGMWYDHFNDGSYGNRASQWYRADRWNYISDMKLNVIRFTGEQDSPIGINMNTKPNWSTNLNKLLTEVASHGCKATPAPMGSPWGPELDIGLVPYPYKNPRTPHAIDPNAYNPWEDLGYLGTWMTMGTWKGAANTEIVGTPINDAKMMVDILAYDNKTQGQITLPSGAKCYGNSLGHDFLRDPTIFYWTISNEQEMGTGNVEAQQGLTWNTQLMTYIHGKGAKVAAAAPYSGGNDYWSAATYRQNFPSTMSDYLELHYYGEWEYRNLGANFYAQMLADFQEMLSQGAYGYTPDKVILGEFGCFLGGGAREGVSTIFTNADRVNVYSTDMKAASDAGLKNLLFHDFFAITQPNFTQIIEDVPYGVVAWGDGYFDQTLADLIKSYYSGTNGGTPTANKLTFANPYRSGQNVSLTVS